jgi:SAM-dependent methyltransferase
MAGTLERGTRGQTANVQLPSPWIQRFAPELASGTTALDLACGSGRHSRVLIGLGVRVVGVDRDLSGVADLADHPLFTGIHIDLESGATPDVGADGFDAVVVTNYLHRPLLDWIIAMVAPGGLLLYETFAAGHERFGRPSRAEFLLQPGELLDAVRGHLRVVAFEDLELDDRVIQHIAARRAAWTHGGGTLRVAKSSFW